ncbi:MAG: hypothetical protein ABJG55_16590 [Paracoccaceae bacterium]
MKFIRIVRQEPILGVGYRAGFLDAAYDLVYDETTPNKTYRELMTVLYWFSDNLERPSKFNRSSQKGAHLKNTKGLSWFKPTAADHIAKAFELRRVLDDIGIFTSVLRTNRIGYVVYEDEFQVVAEPFADTPT